MTPEQFCYWLQGRAELLPDQPPTTAEWKMICEHLALAFKKVTPKLTAPPAGPTDEQLRRLFDEQKTAPLRQYPYGPSPAPHWIPPFGGPPIIQC